MPEPRSPRPWVVVARRETVDLWSLGRGLPMMLALAILLSVTTYLVASNQALNFLEQREAVSLTLQVAVAVGSLLALLASADAISGERERATLESLLLTPAPRRALVVGKAASALTVWIAGFVVTVPYVWVIGRSVGVAVTGLATGLLVGTLLAGFLVALGMATSCLSGSNRTGLAISLFVLLAMFAPTQMPTSAQHGAVGDLLLHVDPFTSGLQALSNVVVSGQGLGSQLEWLAGPVVLLLLAATAAWVIGGRIRLVARER